MPQTMFLDIMSKDISHHIVELKEYYPQGQVTIVFLMQVDIWEHEHDVQE